MKKLVALFLSLMLVVGLFTPALAEQTVVKFWSHQNNAWNADWEKIIAEFEDANPDIKIEYTTFPYHDFEAKMQTSLLAQEAGADVYECWGGWMLDFVSAGALSEVPADYITGLVNDAFEPVLGTMKYKDKYYGAPLELNAGYGGMLVNKKLFEQSGFEYPKTWAEVLDIARKVAKQDGNVMEMRGLEYHGNDALFFNWTSMILQKGGEFLDENGHLKMDTDIAIECLKELVSYITVDHINNTDTNTGAAGYANHDFVCLDECYMATNGPWIVPDAEATWGLTLGEDFDYIAEPPFVEGVEQRWTAETGWSLCVAAKSQVSDAAWKFIEFALEPDRLLRHNIACGQIPPLKSVAQDPALIEAVPYYEPLISILDKSVYVGSYNTDIVKRLFRQVFTSLASEDGTYASVEEACQKLQQDLESQVTYY